MECFYINTKQHTAGSKHICISKVMSNGELREYFWLFQTDPAGGDIDKEESKWN